MGGITNIRVHGNGFIQMDLIGGMRLHVWHPDIPRQKVPTPIHNHRFSFTSRVVAGVIYHQEYSVYALAPGYHHQPSEVYHRYTYDVGTPKVSALRRADTKTFGLLQGPSKDLRAGETYYFKAGAYHTTEPTVNGGISATIMWKTGTDEEVEPSVMCQSDKEPDNEFLKFTHNEPWLIDLVKDVLFL